VRTALRIAGSLLAGGGVLGLVWVLVVWQWQDPFTALYATYQQHRLAASYETIVSSYRPLPAKPTPRPAPQSPAAEARLVAAQARLVAAEARRYRLSLQPGEALGRLRVPRLSLNAVVVAGTDTESLKKGPGWYRGTYLPGEGELIYIAGHRTTYLAPFARIDSLRPGDLVTLEMPYATFVYRVRNHVIVPADDVGRLRSHGREVLALQACHPRFFATQRYIVYAQPLRVLPRNGRPYTLAGRSQRA